MRLGSDLDFLLLGKTGNGKSAVGNSICRREAFESTDSIDSVTTVAASEVTEYKGSVIKIVDLPGVGDTRLNSKDQVDLVTQKIEQAMLMNPVGYHAFLLVVRYGGRFGNEDTEVIQFLKNMFGADFVKKFCVLVMTCGDSFENVNGPKGKSFEKWCSESKGVFRELLDECQGRVVLFDNATTDKGKIETQLDNLVDSVRKLQSSGHRYTDQNFTNAAEMRKKAIVEAREPVIREEILQEVSLILQELNEIKLKFQNNQESIDLTHLVNRCDNLVQHVDDSDRGTGVLVTLVTKINSVKQAVEDTILVQTTAAEERRKMREREAKLQAEMLKENELRNQEIEHIKQLTKEKIDQMESFYKDKASQQAELEFLRKQRELETQQTQEITKLQRDYDERQRKTELQVQQERQQIAIQANTQLQHAQAQIEANSEELDRVYKETRQTSAVEIVMKTCGMLSMAAGAVFVPEIMALLWLSAAAVSSYNNR